MENKFIDIMPGSGLGALKFGMKRAQVTELLGEPFEKEEIEEEEQVRMEFWHYDELELSMGFDESEDWRLVTIGVTSNAYQLQGLELIGLDKSSVEQALSEKNIGPVNVGDDTITSEELGFNIWFEDGKSTEVQWIAHYLDDIEN